MKAPTVKDIVILILAGVILILHSLGLLDNASGTLTGLLGFYIGHRASGNDIG